MSRPIRFSIVVTAPDGLAGCPFIDAWRPELAAHAAELIVADATDGEDDGTGLPIRHRRFPGASLQQLMAHGMMEARGEWVLITEDHCRPLGDVLTAYERTIAAAPHARLIAGQVDNLTSLSPWSWVIFAIGFSEHWRGARRPARSGSNANILIRRDAILESELGVRGGLLYGALRRLTAEGRLVGCRDAAVDHVVELDRHTVTDFEYRVTRNSIEEYRFLGNARRGLGAETWAAIRQFMSIGLGVPIRTWRNIRDAPFASPSLGLRVLYVCAAVAIRLGRDDFLRAVRRDGGGAERTFPGGIERASASAD